MNTKMKIATSLILTGSLISTPMGSILEKSNSIAKAFNKKGSDSKIVISKKSILSSHSRTVY